MKKKCVIPVLLFLILTFSAKGGSCIEDCFDYQYTRQDLTMTFGWDSIKAFEGKGADNYLLEKRWPTVNTVLTPEEEKAQFGTNGLKQAQRQYLSFHFDDSTMRMFVYFRIVHAAGERKVCGWRAELNPPMPKEYLDPNFPEEKKEGMDWQLLIHWVYPSDTRGAGILVNSYNDKIRDQDIWVWFPSLRKSRRLTPANGDDAVAGSDATFAETMLLRLTDEKFQIIGETRYRGLIPVDYYEGLYLADKYGPGTKEYVEFVRNMSQPVDCWVLRAKSVQGGYADWYDTRIMFIDKEWGGICGWEIYNPKGKMMKTNYWPNRRSSDYNGEPRIAWCNLAEVLNFEDRGFTYAIAPQTNFGAPVPETWFTLRELKRSIPTVSIPYMAILPPKKLAPLEDLYSPEVLRARKEFFPERITSFPNPTSIIGMDKF